MSSPVTLLRHATLLVYLLFSHFEGAHYSKWSETTFEEHAKGHSQIWAGQRWGWVGGQGTICLLESDVAQVPPLWPCGYVDTALPELLKFQKLEVWIFILNIPNF